MLARRGRGASGGPYRPRSRRDRRPQRRGQHRAAGELLDQDYPADKVELLIVSDGSTDDTPARLEKLAREHGRVRTWSLARNQGKAVAINLALEHAGGEMVVFTDARQRFAPDALARLAENFADPQVGSASGELVFTQSSRSTISVGLYWKYEVWLRMQESAAGSMLGATGAIYAIRRELFRPLPPGTILDDFRRRADRAGGKRRS